MTKQGQQSEALANALQNQSTMNYSTIFEQFAERGIDDIQPRVNVFSYNAWLAIGRQVRKGEHGVRIVTWIPMSKKDAAGEAQSIGRKPKTVSVFHVSQTDAIAGVA